MVKVGNVFVNLKHVEAFSCCRVGDGAFTVSFVLTSGSVIADGATDKEVEFLKDSFGVWE